MSRKQAHTLIEITIYGALLLVVLTVAYNFYLYGSRYLHKTRAQVQLQQSAGLTGLDLARDLSEASATRIASFPNVASPASPAGVVMLSARDGDGAFRYEPATGNPIWQRYVGYYLDADPESPDDPDIQALYRAEITNRGGLPSNNPPTPVAAGVTTQLLQTSGVNRHLVAHGLRPATPAAPHGGLDAYSLTSANAKTYPTSLTNPVWLDLGFTNLSTGSQSNSFATRLAVMAKD